APGGLWFAPNLSASATRLAMADFPVECLGYNRANDTLYACQKFAFGTVDQDSGAFSSLVHLRDVHDFVQCDGVDSAAACELQLCGAYCGYGHFGSAPICQVYSKPGCGVEVAQAESDQMMVDAGTPPPQVAPAVQEAGTTSTASSSANLQETH